MHSKIELHFSLNISRKTKEIFKHVKLFVEKKKKKIHRTEFVKF